MYSPQQNSQANFWWASYFVKIEKILRGLQLKTARENNEWSRRRITETSLKFPEQSCRKCRCKNSPYALCEEAALYRPLPFYSIGFLSEFMSTFVRAVQGKYKSTITSVAFYCASCGGLIVYDKGVERIGNCANISLGLDKLY